MSTPGGSSDRDGMYSQLIEEDEFRRSPDVGNTLPVLPVRGVSRPSGPGLYRLATFCLAALSAVLLISIIAVAAHNKNTPPGEETLPDVQKQQQDSNMSALIISSNLLLHQKEVLLKEKEVLLKEKEELLAKLNAPKVAPTAEAPPPVCPDDWQLFNSSCYFVSRISRSWTESRTFCQSQGGHLAIILTAEEQTFLWNLLPRGHWNAFWFGVTDQDTEDQWRWVDGSPLVGGFWEEGEPNNHIDEDCGYIVKTQVLERVAIRSWYDAPCTMNWHFICEKKME